MKKDIDKTPDKAGNVGRRVQLSSQAALFMLIPHDADFTSTNTTKYTIAIVPNVLKKHFCIRTSEYVNTLLLLI